VITSTFGVRSLEKAICATQLEPRPAAGVVLTEPGLAGIVAAVKEGRATFQRILAYTHNSVTK
jgi:magnesium-transporting ATPase (P-type)